MLWDKWLARWKEFLDATDRLGGYVETPLEVDSPATEAEVAEVEEQLGFELPSSFRQTLLGFSKRVHFRWDLYEERQPYKTLPEVVRGLGIGECSWDISKIVGLQDWYKDMATVFAVPEDGIYAQDYQAQYFPTWQNKFAIIQMDNGDYIAIDPIAEGQPVIYLSCMENEYTGYRLGDDFIDFMDKWSLLGCPGSEIDAHLPFISSPTSGLEPFSENAKLWRDWFGVNLA
jgi:hypothetical protein